VESIKVTGMNFSYEDRDEFGKFQLGPVDFEIIKGEVMFIVGGNGSGKTTIAKLLTGLYLKENGKIEINDKQIENDSLGEYFSVIFSDFFLFDKLFSIDTSNKEKIIKEYLEVLKLEKKLEIKDNAFSTTDLSGGQRKRLALLKCYLEERPIYLFDEVAADQDPEFRKYFYRTLLPEMKKQGKIVIAITHDDHYFDVADKIIKMDMGQVDLYEKISDNIERFQLFSSKSTETE
ncbi:MAG: ATP-binding cassette domain-containing protein, partial [bacterium]|nr:ATP-binding cassette domain-containing protein [bacterium]